MLSSKDFVKWSSKVVLFLHNTSLCKDEPYPDLLKEKNGIGFPTVSFLDADGKLLKQVGYVTPLEQIDKVFKELLEWQRLRAVVDGGNKAKVWDLFLLEIDMNVRPYAELAETYASLQFPDAQKAKIQQKLLNIQCAELVASVPRKDLRLIGEKLVPIFKEKRCSEGAAEEGFWIALIDHAGWDRDADLYEEVLNRLQELKKGDPRWEQFLSDATANLAKLKAEKK